MRNAHDNIATCPVGVPCLPVAARLLVLHGCFRSNAGPYIVSPLLGLGDAVRLPCELLPLAFSHSFSPPHLLCNALVEFQTALHEASLAVSSLKLTPWS
jgi:hypothetical protein